MSEENLDNVEQGGVEDAPVTGPGQRLRAAREAAGLSREEVATRLRLRLELIRALEEDDQSALPPPAFVSGYLRSYARLLELPADELLGDAGPRETQTTMVSPVMPPRQRRSGDLPVKAVTYLIVLALVVLLVVWWSARRPAPTVAESNSAPTVVKPGGTVELTLPPAAPAAADSGAVVAADSASAVEPATPSTPASAPEAEIQLEATADCWTEIKDATGSQVLFELLKAGTTRTVRGKAPFDVFLGYAPAVTVYYQGQVFDHSRFRRKDVARFHLGKASDNAVSAE